MSIAISIIEKAKLLPERQQQRLLEFATQLENEAAPDAKNGALERSARFHRELGRFANLGLTVSWEMCQQARREAWGKWSDDQE